ncbi:Peptide chain release factor 2 [Flexistipes sinusarabici DSM 4947]|uniref:Peptide chain release factor 2 n=1 Tax=Flexistipes sinusarabici (strain ATCC 49648 / DSM 4947 / MAS 10) TaxID=717231 RepID=F8E8S2_FLESM|nr:peptide chain release factor 2 [Flexistipes sinusarabici]AEI15195.1 Peptide chain release factor 2 [Flexistipes sinusarabici DSM 4947]
MFIDEVQSKVDELKKRIESFSEAVKADDKKKRIKEIERRSVEEPDFWSKRESKYLLKEQSKLKKFLNRYDELLETLENIDVYMELFEEGSEEVKQDIETSVHNLENLVDEFELTLILNDENDSNNAIVTIHSGAGGTEANDWAAMLYRMYSRWIERKNYKQELLDYLPGDEAGIKSVTFNVIGDYSYGYLKGENGIHRLVRQSPFDSNNKRHTSFASVFVLPEIDDDIEVDLNESDLRIDTYRASGAGGQHVNTTDSAVRITHEPTGIVVSCQNERSQHKNKAHAMKILKARLYERELEKKNEERQELEDSKTEMGWGNQIRSYVMHPYKMVKDLRTRHETGNVDAVLDGDIDDFIKSYLLFTAGITDAD